MADDLSGDRLVCASITHESLLQGMYRRSLNWLVCTHGLRVHPPDRLCPAFGRGIANIAVGTNRDLTDLPGVWDIVVGGGCIGYSAGEADGLTLDYVVDCMVPLMVATWLRVDCVLYLQVAEEVEFTGPVPRSRWEKLGDDCEKLLAGLAEVFLPHGKLYICRTDKPWVNAAIVSAVRRSSTFLTDDRLRSIYALNSPLLADSSLGRIQQYKRLVASYLPEVLSTILGRRVGNVLAVENLQQTRVINLARCIALSSDSPCFLGQLAFLPAPSITGARRMCEADDSSKIYLAENADTLAGVAVGMPEYVRWYWQYVAGLAVAELSARVRRNKNAMVGQALQTMAAIVDMFD